MNEKQTFDWIHPELNQLQVNFPANIKVIQTIVGDTSVKPYGSQNLAFHVQDDAKAVHANRIRLLHSLQQQGVKHIHWLEQVHGIDSVSIGLKEVLSNTPAKADALTTQELGQGLAIMTADCLPVVMTDAAGNEVAAIHAGWRGLQAGIIQQTAEKMTQQGNPPAFAWIGAAISQDNFEVGQDVFDAFTKEDAHLAEYFKPNPKEKGKYMADIAGIALVYLSRMGVKAVSSELCSYVDERFYSYRQATHAGDSRTGRMATIIWKV